MTSRARTFQAIGWLLTYPEAPLLAAAPEILEVMEEERLLTATRLASLRRFVEDMRAEDLIEAQERYVGQFDRSRQISLHLFEHVHGESRDRGMAMVNLREVYLAAGLAPDSTELPDFLPMYLEYLSRLPLSEARNGLGDVAPILQVLHKRLAQRGSRYADLVCALLDIAGVKPLALDKGSDVEPADDTPEAIDRAWEETAVAFGPENDPQKGGDCGRASAMMERINQLDRGAGSGAGTRTEVGEARK